MDVRVGTELEPRSASDGGAKAPHRVEVLVRARANDEQVLVPIEFNDGLIEEPLLRRIFDTQGDLDHVAFGGTDGHVPAGRRDASGARSGGLEDLMAF